MFPMYAELLAYLAAVTKMLNETKLPDQSDFYLRVQLVEAGTHQVAGEWSDEIGDDCWGFDQPRQATS